MGGDDRELRRPLGLAERFYWLYDQASCVNFCVVAELARPVDPGALRRGLAAAGERHPALRVRVGRDDRGRVAFCPVGDGGSGPEPRPSPPVALDEGSGPWLATALEQLDTPFPPDGYPLVRCRCLPATDGAPPAAVFCFSHAITDAGSAARLVLEVLGPGARGEAVPLRSAVPPLEQRFPPRWRGLGSRLAAAWSPWSEAGRYLAHGLPRPLPGAVTPASRRLAAHPIALDRRATSAWVERCRAEETTAHAALGAAQLIALAEEFGGKAVPLALQSAVDLRATLEPPVEPADLGVHIGVVVTVHRVAADADRWSLARAIRAQLDGRVDAGHAHRFWSTLPPPAWLPPDARGARRLWSLLDRFAPPSTIVTNLGRLSADDADGVLALHFLMAPMRGIPLCTSACALDGRLRAYVVVDEAMVGGEGGGRIAGGIAGELREMFGSA